MNNQPKASANPVLVKFFLLTAFLLGISLVLNIWIGREYKHLMKEYEAISKNKTIDPSGEGKEIERKWLVDRDKIPYDLEKDADKYELTQTYLNFSPEVRVRNISNKRYIMAIKTGLTEKKGLTREETQYDITKEEYEHLLTKQEGETIYKTRYQIKIDGNTYAFDFFHEQLDGLTYLEIEFPSEDEANAFEAPSWLGKDVTNDINYKNQKLAQNGIPATFEQDSKE
jgi:CYTH domain-containing protein